MGVNATECRVVNVIYGTKTVFGIQPNSATTLISQVYTKQTEPKFKQGEPGFPQAFLVGLVESYHLKCRDVGSQMSRVINTVQYFLPVLFRHVFIRISFFR